MAKKRKIIGWTVAGIIGLSVIGSMMGEESAEPTVTTPKVESANTEEAKKAETVTKSNYDKIKQGDALTGEGGMDKASVESMFGDPESVTEMETDLGGGNKVKTETATWMTSDFEIVTVVYTNGKVSSKMWTK